MRRCDFISYCRLREHIDSAAAEDCRNSGDMFAAGWFHSSAEQFRRAAEAAVQEAQAATLAEYSDDHPGWSRLERDLSADRFDFFHQ